MKTLLNTLTAFGVATGLTVAAQAQTIDLTFEETAVGQWDVRLAVTGDVSTTSGISSYSIFTTDTSASFDENTMGTVNSSFAPIGFQNFTDGVVGSEYNAGNFQAIATSILNIGEEPVFNPGAIPGSTPEVDLGVPALLGVMNTVPGLGEDDFRGGSFGLFNAAGDGFSQVNPEVISTVVPIPEPTTAVLLGMGGMAVLTRRRSRA